ncbi:unnamed protein product [Peronospora belbahrii]|uniref:Uncharacterized protein n=1 Tax=Peronospora belbahrii TaxID=622444 RepID=A0AAU9KZE6_9STRA|nr:unnamed protein product [Peronospora belbahrii]
MSVRAGCLPSAYLTIIAPEDSRTRNRDGRTVGLGKRVDTADTCLRFYPHPALTCCHRFWLISGFDGDVRRSDSEDWCECTAYSRVVTRLTTGKQARRFGATGFWDSAFGARRE